MLQQNICMKHTNGPSRKRRRATSDPQSGRASRRVKAASTPFVPPPKLQRDSEFWFEDGSIILIAQNVGFRVYKRLLCEHSPFFRDLFNIPQPTDVPKIDGCPVIQTLDWAWQLRHLFRIIFPTQNHITYVPVVLDPA